MDTSSAAAECVTLQAAGGFNIHLFPTGQGNIIGNPMEAAMGYSMAYPVEYPYDSHGI